MMDGLIVKINSNTTDTQDMTKIILQPYHLSGEIPLHKHSFVNTNKIFKTIKP